jgi:hypothetical protein
VIPVSRRINHPDGSFAGVALAAIHLDCFRKIHQGVDVGQAGATVLVLDSGALVLRTPFDVALIGRDMSKGRVFPVDQDARAGWLGGAAVDCGRGRANLQLSRPRKLSAGGALETTGLAGAVDVAESFRAAVHGAMMEHKGNRLGVATVSAGALLPHGSDTDPLKLVRDADRGGGTVQGGRAGSHLAGFMPVAIASLKLWLMISNAF